MLTDIQVRKAKPSGEKPYKITDGKGLYIEIQTHGSKLWRVRFRFEGKENTLSLGSYPEVTLGEAREKRDEIRSQLAKGQNPSRIRKEGKADRLNTFKEAFLDWQDKKCIDLAEEYRKQVIARINADILPWIGNLPIRDIKPPEILDCLRRVEARGALETSSRLLTYCSQIFRFGVASGLVESDPCRDLRGALKKATGKHLAAFTKPDDIARLLKAVKGYNGGIITRTALLFGIYTFVRPGNLRQAEWSEMHGLDSDKPEWRIPGKKMKIKSERAFIVPLAKQAVQLLKEIQPLTVSSKFVFPSPRGFSRPLSNNAVNTAYRNMGFSKEEMTGHGVRAMARTVCDEVLGFAPDVIEEQLAHEKAGALRGAYNRTTHMKERVRLMSAYADWIDSLPAWLGSQKGS